MFFDQQNCIFLDNFCCSLRFERGESGRVEGKSRVKTGFLRSFLSRSSQKFLECILCCSIRSPNSQSSPETSLWASSLLQNNFSRQKYHHISADSEALNYSGRLQVEERKVASTSFYVSRNLVASSFWCRLVSERKKKDKNLLKRSRS